jgi:hypothetical protein
MNKILTENNEIFANVSIQTVTNQAHLNPCTALHTYIIESNIVHIIYNLIARRNRKSRCMLKRVRL